MKEQGYDIVEELEKNSKKFKRFVFGLCRKVSYKNKEEMAKTFYKSKITSSINKEKMEVSNLPNCLEVPYDNYRKIEIVKLKNSHLNLDVTYRIELLYYQNNQRDIIS